MIKIYLLFWALGYTILLKGMIMMNKFYEMEIAGLKRQLPLCKINDDLYIGAFIMFGDVEITKACAKELLKKAPEHDIMITAECKSIPLLYEMARQEGADNYIVIPADELEWLQGDDK
jgi:hypothetical protein